jgi:hypothetical protein
MGFHSKIPLGHPYKPVRRGEAVPIGFVARHPDYGLASCLSCLSCLSCFFALFDIFGYGHITRTSPPASFGHHTGGEQRELGSIWTMYFYCKFNMEEYLSFTNFNLRSSLVRTTEEWIMVRIRRQGGGLCE